MTETQIRKYVVLTLLFVAGLGVGLFVARKSYGPLGGWCSTGRTRIDQAAIIDRLQSASDLVTTEVALRDVVSYENTRLGSTKRALVVVTGKGLVGFDLGDEGQAK